MKIILKRGLVMTTRVSPCPQQFDQAIPALQHIDA